MTKMYINRTVVEQVLEAWDSGAGPCREAEVFEALRAALEQQAEPVEPVAWLYRDSWGTMKLSQVTPPPIGAFPVYTAPPQRKLLPLKTVEKLIYENTKINPNVADDRELLGYIVNAVRAIEAAHGIKE